MCSQNPEDGFGDGGSGGAGKQSAARLRWVVMDDHLPLRCSFSRGLLWCSIVLLDWFGWGMVVVVAGT